MSCSWKTPRVTSALASSRATAIARSTLDRTAPTLVFELTTATLTNLIVAPLARSDGLAPGRLAALASRVASPCADRPPPLARSSLCGLQLLAFVLVERRVGAGDP